MNQFQRVRHEGTVTGVSICRGQSNSLTHIAVSRMFDLPGNSISCRYSGIIHA